MQAINRKSWAALAVAGAFAAPALAQQLTPMGAERAANADGSIPAWTAKIVGTPPGLQFNSGDRYPDPYASEKPLVVITPQNMAQHESKLTEGQKAMFKRYPDTFKMYVYPSHRDFALPETKYNAIRTWAARTTMTSDQNGLRDFPPLAPFPKRQLFARRKDTRAAP